MDWKTKFVEMLFPLDARELQMEAAFRLKHANLPPSIYKYREFNKYSVENLRNGTVWLADPQAFNDPYDCASTIDLSRMETDGVRKLKLEYLAALPASIDRQQLLDAMRFSEDPMSAMIDHILDTVGSAVSNREALKSDMKAAFRGVGEEYLRGVSERVKSGFKLCSFSERLNSTLMWAHYAKKHKGFCVEYDIRSLAPDDYRTRFLYPVIYLDRLFDVTEHVLRSVEDPSFNNLYWNLAGLQKARDWAYEQEWRLLFANGSLPTAGAWPMPKPKAVYLGSHVGRRQQRVVHQVCEEMGIPMFKMKLSANEFLMEPCSIAEADRKAYVPRSNKKGSGSFN